MVLNEQRIKKRDFLENFCYDRPTDKDKLSQTYAHTQTSSRPVICDGHADSMVLTTVSSYLNSQPLGRGAEDGDPAGVDNVPHDGGVRVQR